jgi:hypothetical protein
MLTQSNYKDGFLADDEWVGGVIEDNNQFLVYIIDCNVSKLVLQKYFNELQDALNFINSFDRAWVFESPIKKSCGSGECGSGECGKDCGKECDKDCDKNCVQ